MKRGLNHALPFLLSLSLLLGLLPGMAFAKEPDITVYVTVSRNSSFAADKDGESVIQRTVTVNSGATLDDALRALHESAYAGGVSEGYGSVQTDFGTSLTKLWGNDSGNFGYYVNSEMAMSLDTPLSTGDQIDAIVYQYAYPDTEAYACFDTRTATIGTDDPLELTLSYVSGYDSQTWEPIVSSLPNATITVDGQATELSTDGNGKASISLADGGVHVVSAVGPNGTNITAPACVVTAVAPVTVEVSAQDDYSFSYIRHTLTVPYGTAQAYGFSNSTANCVTALDALVAAHRDQYGSGFTKETAETFLTVNSFGSPVEIFDNNNTDKYLGFCINHHYPMDHSGTGYAVASAPLTDGDLVDFFYYEDDGWCDYLSWFTDMAGNVVDRISVESDEAFSINLQGFTYIMGYSNPTALAVYGENNALSLYIVDATGTLVENLGNVTSPDGTNLSFSTPGDYWITVRGSQQDGYPLICPLLKVTVRASDSIVDNEISSLTVSSNTLTPEFSKNTFAYTLSPLPYDTSSISTKMTFSAESAVTAHYTNVNGVDLSVTGFNPGTSKSLPDLKAGTTSIVFSITPPADSSSLSRIYSVTTVRETALTGLTLQQGGLTVPLNSSFAPETTNYTATALAGTNLVVTPALGGDASHTIVSVNGDTLTDEAATAVSIQLGENTVTVKTASTDGTTETTYTVTVIGVASTQCAFTLGTMGSVLKLYDAGGNELTPTDGTIYTGLVSGLTYTYNVSKYGCVTAHGTILAGSDTTKSITLTKAPANTLHDLNAQWKNFRNSDVNMAITNAETPRSAAEAQLQWEQAVGSVNGWQIENAPGLPLIIDGYLYLVSGTSLQKRSLADGRLVANGSLAGQSAYTYIAPAYGEGMIFVALTGGIVQALDAETLQSLWVYADPLGGQDQVSVTYSDGYVYTGFYNSSGNGNYVCLAATDEVPSQTNETKYATWTVSNSTGFYWAGAYVGEKAVIVASEKGTLYSLDKITGAILDMETFVGNGRSSIAYDAANGKLFFTTDSGYLYSTSVNESGKFSELVSCKLGIASTSTPVVYDGYVFVGATCALKDWRILMIDAATMVEAGCTENLSGYPQSSLLLSTAYVQSTGKIYLYTTCNAVSGGITVVEADLSAKVLTASELFVPMHSGFSVSSLICDPYGTLYYKNDSGYLFAVATHTVTGCPVSFSCTPSGASVTLKDVRSQVIPPVSIGGMTQNGSYDLAQGTYAYTVAQSGYESKSGSFNVTAAEASVHTGKNISVILSQTVPTTPSNASVSFQLLGDTHHSDTTVHTYGKNGSLLPAWIPTTTISIPVGSCVLDVFYEVMETAGLSYQESSGYISAIQSPGGGVLSEFDNGANSGWLYIVNGTPTTKSMAEYTLSGNEKIVVFYSDDYTKESGSETWNPGAVPPFGSVSIVPSVTMSGDIASTTVEHSEVIKAIQSLGNSAGGELVIDPAVSGNVAALEITISKAAVQLITNTTSASLRIQGLGSSISIPNDALINILKQMAGSNLEIKISVLAKNALNSLLSSLGEVSSDGVTAVAITLSSNNQKITQFNGSSLYVCIPTGSRFVPNFSYKVLSISADGKRETLSGTCVSRDNNLLIEAATTHLSTFIALPQSATCFADVPADFWCYDAVSYVTGNGLFNGTSSSIFSPNVSMSRAMLVTVLYRLDGSPAISSTNTVAFSDIPSGSWCADAVAWGAQSGIMNGYSDTLFGQSDPVSRQQVAAVLYRYAAYQQYETSKSAALTGYADANSVNDWAAPAMRWATAAGLINGTTASTLSPFGYATRAQVAVILSRFCKNFTTED